METVEYLMVCKNAAVQSMVDEPFVQRAVYRFKTDIITSFLENVLQTVGLFHAVGTDID